MSKINREDMLELTRRMNLSRNCFSRIAGAYMDEDGYVDGTFNTHFLKLSPPEQASNLALAKAIPFAETNVRLKEYEFAKGSRGAGSVWQLLMGLTECELKNDALLDMLYEEIGEHYITDESYAVYFFYGNYDVPVKGSDKESMWESEEIYRFIVCAVCPLLGDYEPGEPEYGFLFPAFRDRSGDSGRINIFHKDKTHGEMLELLGLAEN